MVPLPDVFAENVAVIDTTPCVSETVGLVDVIVAVGLGNLYVGVGALAGEDDAVADEVGEVLGDVVLGVEPLLLPPPHAATASASTKLPPMSERCKVCCMRTILATGRYNGVTSSLSFVEGSALSSLASNSENFRYERCADAVSPVMSAARISTSHAASS